MIPKGSDWIRLVFALPFPSSFCKLHAGPTNFFLSGKTIHSSARPMGRHNPVTFQSDPLKFKFASLSEVHWQRVVPYKLKLVSDTESKFGYVISCMIDHSLEVQSWNKTQLNFKVT